LKKKHGVFQLLAIHGFYLKTIHVKSLALPSMVLTMGFCIITIEKTTHGFFVKFPCALNK